MTQNRRSGTGANLASAGSEEARTEASSSPSPEMQAKLGEIRSKLSTAFSQVTLAMMTTPRYRHMAIADLEWLVLEPLLRDRIAIAHSRKEADDQSGIVGFAIWAKVSDEVSGKIEEQAKAGTFPVRLRGGEWASGETIWLLDVVAANRQLATAVLVNFGQLAKGAPVRIHPAIRRWVEPEVLARLAKSGIK